MITDEQSKAVQEVAKTAGTIAELAGKVGGFVSKIVGGASEQIGGILEDRMRYYRYKNLLSIAHKVDVIHSKRKIMGKTTQIPPRLAIPMLESAALEDDETLQDVWAKLVANATDPSFKEPLHPGYIEVVRQLLPDETIILSSFLQLHLYPNIIVSHVREQREHTEGSGMDYFWLRIENKFIYSSIYEVYLEHCKSLQLKTPENSRVYIDNLLRLRLVELGFNFSGKEKGSPFFSSPQQSTTEQENILIPARDEYLRMTSFGQSFVAACIADTV